MRKLTEQQMFDKAVLGVVRQGALSRTSAKNCRYRLEQEGKTLACGVGHLIADDLYTPSIEGAAASDARPERSYCTDARRADALMLSLCFSGVDITDDDTVALLDEIQSAHDLAESVGDFVNQCRLIAEERGLRMPSVQVSA